MTTPWGLTLRIDAHGHDSTRVSTLPMVGSPQRRLQVRVGLVTVQCLDGASAMSAGMAWATARLQARQWLPDLQQADEWRMQRVRDSGYGGAFPAGSLLLDGRQRWLVTAREDTMLVTVGPLQVVVHDITALDTHVRAWTEATAIATRVFPGKAVPFNRLLDQARRRAYAEADRSLERAASRRKGSRAADRSR